MQLGPSALEPQKTNQISASQLNRSGSVPQSAAPGTLGPGRAGSFVTGQSYANFSLSFDVIAHTGSTSAFAGSFVRVSTPGLGTLNGYAVGIDFSVDRLFISKVVGEASKGAIGPNAASASLTLNPSDVYTVNYTAIGADQQATLIDKTTSTVLATVSGSDATYASGQVGLGLALQTGTAGLQTGATFGNFAVSSVPEPSTWALGVLGLAGVIAAGARRNR
jgi:PEP-CTERM motif